MLDPLRVTIERDGTRRGDPAHPRAGRGNARHHKEAALTRVLDVEDPTAALVFCRTRKDVEELDAHDGRARPQRPCAARRDGPAAARPRAGRPARRLDRTGGRDRRRGPWPRRRPAHPRRQPLAADPARAVRPPHRPGRSCRPRGRGDHARRAARDQGAARDRAPRRPFAGGHSGAVRRAGCGPPRRTAGRPRPRGDAARGPRHRTAGLRRGWATPTRPRRSPSPRWPCCTTTQPASTTRPRPRVELDAERGGARSAARRSAASGGSGSGGGRQAADARTMTTRTVTRATCGCRSAATSGSAPRTSVGAVCGETSLSGNDIGNIRSWGASPSGVPIPASTSRRKMPTPPSGASTSTPSQTGRTDPGPGRPRRSVGLGQDRQCLR